MAGETPIHTTPVSFDDARGTQVVFIFNSIHRVLKAEQTLKRAGIPFRLVPTPRPLVSDCGMAILGAREDAERIHASLAGERLRIVKLFAGDENGWWPVNLPAA